MRVFHLQSLRSRDSAVNASRFCGSAGLAELGEGRAPNFFPNIDHLKADGRQRLRHLLAMTDPLAARTYAPLLINIAEQPQIEHGDIEQMIQVSFTSDQNALRLPPDMNMGTIQCLVQCIIGSGSSLVCQSPEDVGVICSKLRPRVLPVLVAELMQQPGSVSLPPFAADLLDLLHPLVWQQGDT